MTERIDGVRPVGSTFELVAVKVDQLTATVAVIFTMHTKPSRTFGWWWNLTDYTDDCVWWSEPNAAGISAVIAVTMNEHLYSITNNILTHAAEIPVLDGVVWLNGPPPTKE